MGLYENMKELVSLIQKADNLELQKKLLDLQNDVMALTDENSQLKKKLEELQRTTLLAQELRFESPFYFRTGDHIPHCSRCWEVDKRLIHLTGPQQPIAGERWDCPQCDKHFIKPGTRRSVEARTARGTSQIDW